ncbi:MAG: ATP:corrinoid adenosyltransferase BtuR/CobO/CobP [Desulfotomaculum sp. 46_296]|nr:MAG: ATP:corrinoid adenosyltransferase BtuR/CobO/CobP [Desulfotomaculum sp. 46_296]HAU31418.1 cob(I)yrinic acid a,c-diamide adenosyltransferase [Desulfotomaculum sp.]
MIVTRLEKGYVQVYTGNSKGKTTAALGLAFRAMGCGLRTYMGQFMKGAPSSEIVSAGMVSGFITIEQFGRGALFSSLNLPSADDFKLAGAGIDKIRAAMFSGEYSIVILDEINTAIFFKLVELKDVLKLIREKPGHLELVLTGRNAPPELIQEADLVTEMVEIKHYYQKGILPREGIER